MKVYCVADGAIQTPYPSITNSEQVDSLADAGVVCSVNYGYDLIAVFASTDTTHIWQPLSGSLHAELLKPLQQRLQRHILSWYAKHKRDLPWRTTTNPYEILVSETMLQQTQVDRVIPFYERWLKRFPDFKSLAQADTPTLLALWSGLGYNNRALRLRQLAQQLADRPFPQSEKELVALPGIGPYTARAVLAFAFNKEVAVVDTNIRRVLIHELGLSSNIKLSDLEACALASVPAGQSCIWHNALMDYGATAKTSHVTGIRPISKQSRFVGSDREVSGYIVRQLTRHKTVSIADICQQYGNKRTNRVIEKLIKQCVIKRNNTTLTLD